jgi:hypothetical protein
MAQSDVRRRVRIGVLLVVFACVCIAVWMRLRPADTVSDARRGQTQSSAQARGAPTSAPRHAQSEDAADVDARPRASALDVTVLRADGTPAAGATVSASLPRDDIGGASSTRKTADAHGLARFPLPSGAVCLYAWLGDEAGGTTEYCFGRSSASVSIRLEAGVPVRGHVVERGGRPVAGATVTASVRVFFDAGCPWTAHALTSDDGAFDLPSVPATALATEPFGLQISATAPGFPEYGISIKPDTPRSDDIVLVLMRPAKLRGRFLRPDGTPVVGEILSVHASDDSDDVVSGPDGRFEREIERGGADVAAFPRRRWGGRANTEEGPSGWGCPRLLGRVRGDAGDVDLGDIVLAPGARLAGVVVGADGNPIAGASVMLHLGSDQVGLTASGADGRFAFDSVGDQPHRLSVSQHVAPEPSLDSRDATVEGVRGGDTALRVAVTGAGTTVVRFIDAATRERVLSQKVKVKLRDPAREDDASEWAWDGSVMDRWRFEPETPGTFEVTVEIEGYEPSDPVAVIVLADRETVVDVPLRKKHE